ncbi:MAG: CocE/NonD family hydrolase [Acidobacteria bacterium]|nr:CocE/NonD family hydrolase [Acidobacteriota bacterium]
MRFILTLLTGLLALQATTPYDAVLFQKDVMIPTRGGTRLATDIYRPARNGVPVEERLPILLQRTPYNKEGGGLVEGAKYFVRNGYVVALQDIRGRYKSEGSFHKYDEVTASDGYDTIQWLAKLPYTDGKVGMWGTSYGAHTQADAAKLNPPNLKALLLNFGGLSNGWKVKVRNHGAFELGQQLGCAWEEAGSDDPAVRAALQAEPIEKWFTAMPLRKGLNPLSISPEFESYVIQEMTHGDYDEYWKGLGVNWAEHYAGTADIPMLHVGGWYDTYAASTLENYLGLSKTKRSPIRLMFGPWTHGGNANSTAGEVDFGRDAAMPNFSRELHLQWFDHYLKGKPSPVSSWPPIRLFVMGTGDGHKDANGRLYHGGYWRDEKEWPLPGTNFVKYYFKGDGSLDTGMPIAGSSPTTYRYDPHNPVPTIGGAFSGALRRGAFDQRERENGFPGSKPPYLPLKARPDVVVFQTEPLKEDVEVIGPIKVVLYASSTAVDTDFTAKLLDVYTPSKDFPNGFDMNLTDGIIRARYRNSPLRQELMKPGEVYQFVIEAFPTANVFKKGHRIRIDISSSNFPRFDVNPNTGEPLGQHRRMITADNSIHHDAVRPSHVVLPIVPGRSRQ